MHPGLKTVASAAVALSLCVCPTMASAATANAVQPINPLLAVSAFGTEASAKAVFAQSASGASAAGAAVAAQGQPPAGDDAPPPGSDFGINWILLGLGSLFFLGGLATLFIDDDDDGRSAPISPV